SHYVPLHLQFVLCRGICFIRFLPASAVPAWIRMHLRPCVHLIAGAPLAKRSLLITGRRKFLRRWSILCPGIRRDFSHFSIGPTPTARSKSTMLGSHPRTS